jgi:hypothetical protein
MDFHRRLMLRGLGALLSGRLVAGPCGAEEPRYDVVDLGTLPGGRSTEPRSINSKGEVVGVTARLGGGPSPSFTGTASSSGWPTRPAGRRR